MNILFGDVVSVSTGNRGSKYDERAIADAVTRLRADALASGWEAMSSGSPNWVRRVGNPSDVRNLYAEAIAYLDTAEVVPKAEVVFQNEDGSRERFLLTTDELLATQKSGVLPDAANITRRFAQASEWTTKGPAAQAAEGKANIAAFLAVAAAAYLAFK